MSAILALTLAASVVTNAQVERPAAPASTEPIAPVPPTVALDPRRVALGERLFHDRRLSGDDARSCATCHPIERGGMDGLDRPVTATGQVHARNTPTIFNVGLSASFNWDGAATSLEAHADAALLSPKLMNIRWPDIFRKLAADRDYASEFKAIYRDGLTRNSVLDALASYERSLQTPNSRFDRYLVGDRSALTPDEKRGYGLFKSYGCVSCHQGVNVGGNVYQKFGIFVDAGPSPDGAADLGRYQVTRVPRDRGVFRVPSLRNVAVTAPYFHDGRTRTLDAAVATMARVQLGRSLAPDEIAAIVAFLGTLTGEYRGRPVTAATAAR